MGDTLVLSDIFDEKDARRQKLKNNRKKNKKNYYNDDNDRKSECFPKFIKTKKIKKFRENVSYQDDFFGWGVEDYE